MTPVPQVGQIAAKYAIIGVKYVRSVVFFAFRRIFAAVWRYFCTGICKKMYASEVHYMSFDRAGRFKQG